MISSFPTTQQKPQPTVPKLPIPRDPMRDGVEQWRNGHYAGVLSGTHDANDIYINPLDWYERNNINLSAGVRAIGIDRLSKTVYASGGHLVLYDKLVQATGSLPFMPPIGGLHSDDGALLPGIFAFRTVGKDSRIVGVQGCAKNPFAEPPRRGCTIFNATPKPHNTPSLKSFTILSILVQTVAEMAGFVFLWIPAFAGMAGGRGRGDGCFASLPTRWLHAAKRAASIALMSVEE